MTCSISTTIPSTTTRRLTQTSRAGTLDFSELSPIKALFCNWRTWIPFFNLPTQPYIHLQILSIGPFHKRVHPNWHWRHAAIFDQAETYLSTTRADNSTANIDQSSSLHIISSSGHEIMKQGLADDIWTFLGAVPSFPLTVDDENSSYGFDQAVAFPADLHEF
jgi:hypothetical protein